MRFVQAGTMVLGIAVYFGVFFLSSFENGSDLLFYIIIGYNVLLLVAAILAVIDSVRKIRAKKTGELTTAVFVVKLVAIPYFLINFALWALVALGGAATLIHGIGIALLGAAAVATVLTYLAMLSTSVYGWASVVQLRRDRRIGRALAVLYTILLFVFVADTVVGILLFVHYRRSSDAVIEDVKSPVESITAD
jgi:amino acid transporter